MQEVRLGVIGIGHMGSAHARGVHDGLIRDVRLTAVCDVRPERLAWAREALPEARGFDDWRALITSGCADAVLIATPHPLHGEIAAAAMRAGLHVLSEKPVDIRVSQARLAAEAARETGRLYAVMFNQRTEPLFRRARELVHSGALGELKRSVWLITNWYRTQHYYDSGDWRATWSGEGGGVLMNQAPHNLDLWQWICGMPVSVSARCDCARFHRIEVEDDATLLTRFANGATGLFVTSTGEYPGTNRLEISGTRGKLVLEQGTLRWWELERDEREVCFTSEQSMPEIPMREQVYTPEAPGTAHAGILQNFVNAILHGEPLIARGEEGLAELSLSNAAYLSAWQGGREIPLPLDDAAFDAALREKQAASVARESVSGPAPDATYSERWQVRWN